MTITAIEITEQEAHDNEVDCGAVDFASMLVAELHESENLEGCSQIPAWAVSFKPAEDMVIPIFLCKLHFNALKISLHEGVGVDEDVFGEFPNH